MLLVAETELSEDRIRELQEALDSRFGKVKLIPVRGNPRAVIVRTTNDVVPRMRDQEHPLLVGGRAVRPVSTSGAVGNLKRRALGAEADGQVPE